jgi:hypothetical protein
LSSPYGASSWQIAKIAQQTDTSAKHAKNQQQTQNSQTANRSFRRTAKQQQNLQDQQTAARIQKSGNSAGRLPAGNIRPRNIHCMIMLPT